MRIFALLSLAALAAPLSGCCGAPSSEPELAIRSPVWLRTRPVLVEQDYAIAGPAPAPSLSAVRRYTPPAPAYRYEPLPAARAVGGCGGGEVPYSPPPVPGSPEDVPESIPASRR